MSTARLPGSGDTRILLAGVVAFVALAAYLGVAYANTHATSLTAQQLARKIVPFVPHGSHLVAVPSGVGGGYAVHVTPLAVGNYGALASSYVYEPPAGRWFVLSLWLRGSRAGQISRQSRPGRIGIVVGEQGLGGTSTRFVVNTTVPATSAWHRFAFRRRVEGRRLSISLYVTRNVFQRADVARSWFEMRDVGVKFP